jgi:peptidoglycan/LPS O-acetylase OafA/YrhL
MLRLPALTTTRLFVALLVLVHHYAFCNGGTLFCQLRRADQWHSSRLPVIALLRAGYMGISLFLVLFGFILTYTCVNRNGMLPRRRRDFWIARVARIYPLYMPRLN